MTSACWSARAAVIVHSGFCRRRDFAAPASGSGPRGLRTGPGLPRLSAWPGGKGSVWTRATPLVGIFGHLKRTSESRESLRAFRRLLRVEPRAKLILVGERIRTFR